MTPPDVLRFSENLHGAYRGVGYDRDRARVVVATDRGLYLIDPRGGGPLAGAVTPVPLEGWSESKRLTPCRDGGIVVAAQAGEDGITRLDVHALSGGLEARIEAPSGRPFRSFVLGGPGRAIATVTACATQRWCWQLWTRGGTNAGQFETAAGVKAGFDPTGERLLVVWDDHVEVRDGRGAVVGKTIQGAFHKAAMSDMARVLVLNRDDDRTRVVVMKDGRSVSHAFDAIVHGVAVAPDGRSAWAWFRGGVIRSIDVEAGTVGKAISVAESSRESLEVTSLVAEDRGTALVGFATRPAGTEVFNGGRIARIDPKDVLWRQEFATPSPTAFFPAALPAGGVAIAWNREALAVVKQDMTKSKRKRR
ncbi:MAG TPA: hypothetical protein VF139_10635 [Candidatus Polarisedimenticolaceae bacterium]